MNSPDRYAVVGWPVAHSRSPQIHTLFAQQTGQALVYEAIAVEPENFPARVHDFFTTGGRGLNITVPHKQAAHRLSASLTERARLAGAVNTLWPDAAGSLRGDNTDGAGLVRDLIHNLHWTLRARRVLLLGAGGAARGALAPLLALQPTRVVIANRTTARAMELADRFSQLGPVSGCGMEAIEPAPFDVIINATSAGVAGEIARLPDRAVAAHTHCYDMAYGKSETAFTRWARERGAEAAEMGLGMLVEQAAEAFELWRGVRPATAPVLSVLRAA